MPTNSAMKTTNIAISRSHDSVLDRLHSRSTLWQYTNSVITDKYPRLILPHFYGIKVVYIYPFDFWQEIDLQTDLKISVFNGHPKWNKTTILLQ